MNKSVVIVPLGRFSPPHKEHESLVNAVLKLAKQTRSDAKIFVSRTVDKKKNPLTPQEKIKFLNKMFPGHKGLFDMPPMNNPTMIGSLAELSGKYSTVHIVLGDDRVAETEKLVNKYNGKDFTFDKIVVHSRHSIISTRVGDADGVHASDIRNWARAGDFDKVRESMSKHLTDANVKEIIHLIQNRLGKTTVDESMIDDMFLEYIFESDEPTITFPSDDEMSKQIDSMSNSELDLDDADVLMLDLIVGKDIEKETVSEGKVLSIQTRQKLSQRMKGMAKRLARLRQIKAKQMPANQRLRMRARKAAIMMLRKRATGKKNLDYNSLSKSQRIAVDNALVQRFGKSLNSAVDKLSKRIMPMIRKKAQTNVAKANIKEGADVVYPGTKKLVPDQKKDNPLNVDPNKLTINTIDPTKDDRLAPDPKTAHLNRNRKLRFHSVFNTEGRKSSADKDARDAGDTNIIYQMRKTINSRGEHETTFADGHKAHISVNDAKKLLAKFEALRMPADKHEFTIQAGRSLTKFRDVLAHGVKHEKKKISLGGKQFNEFYLGVGRTRAVSPTQRDEPPGTRNIGEVAKDEDRPDDPNRSRPLSQKLDLLLRLGLSDQEELQKYRRALRSSKKHALQSPQMREALANLLDKLIDLTTKDPATYSRVRYNVMNKEANSLLRKAEESGIAVDIIYEVFTRGLEVNNSVNEAFNRVNSFIAGGKAAQMDSDLSEKVKAPAGGLKGACWKNYTAVGMKMKNGRKVPNCVPKEETQIDELSTDTYHRAANKAAKRAMSDVQGRSGPIFKKYAAKANKFRDKGMSQEKKEKSVKENSQIDEMPSVRSASKGNLKGRLYDPNKFYHQTGYRAKSYRLPGVPSKADVNVDAEKAKQSFSGTITKLPPGKKTPKTMIRPRDYMKPNQASRVTEQVSTHDATPLSKRVKRVKSFHAWHPKTNEDIMQRHADHTVVRVKNKGNFIYKKIYREAYTGSEPTSNNPNDPANRFVGTNTIVKNFAGATPGQDNVAAGQIAVAAFAPEKVDYTSSMNTKKSRGINESFAAGFQLAPFARDLGMRAQGSFEHHPDVQEQLDDIEEATYKGKTVPLNKPMKGDVKKSKVYVDPDGDGKAKKVNFGDKKLSIKKDQPARKRSYCARSSGQGNLSNKSSANYWSRRAWDC